MKFQKVLALVVGVFVMNHTAYSMTPAMTTDPRDMKRAAEAAIAKARETAAAARRVIEAPLPGASLARAAAPAEETTTPAAAASGGAGSGGAGSGGAGSGGAGSRDESPVSGASAVVAEEDLADLRELAGSLLAVETGRDARAEDFNKVLTDYIALRNAHNAVMAVPTYLTHEHNTFRVRLEYFRTQRSELPATADQASLEAYDALIGNYSDELTTGESLRFTLKIITLVAQDAYTGDQSDKWKANCAELLERCVKWETECDEGRYELEALKVARSAIAERLEAAELLPRVRAEHETFTEQLAALRARFSALKTTGDATDDAKAADYRELYRNYVDLYLRASTNLAQLELVIDRTPPSGEREALVAVFEAWNVENEASLAEREEAFEAFRAAAIPMLPSARPESPAPPSTGGGAGGGAGLRPFNPRLDTRPEGPSATPGSLAAPE